jgi:hypothetical protein
MRVRRALLAVSFVAAIVVTLVVLTGSEAATPGSGTVSGSQTAVSWDGDYKVPTGGGCKGPNDATCDNYRLTIEPPSYGFMVTIKLQPLGDWDLAVYGPDGGLAGSSGNAPNQTEVVILTNPAGGTYTVSAAPFAPAPGLPSYRASATITSLDSTTPSNPGSENLTFSNYQPPKGMGEDSGEPSIGANWASGNSMFQAGLQTLKTSWDDSVSPARASWTDVSAPETSVASLDPIGFLDHQTNRWFSSQLSGTTSLAAFTDDDGGLWLPSEGGPGNGGVDHQTVGGGPFHAPLTRDPKGPLYPNAVYYCSQDLVAALCGRSDNGGISFAPAVPIYTDECGGLHGHVKVAPDGTVYVPNRGCGEHQAVVVSEDNGLTWAVRPIPESTPGAWDPTVTIDADGTVYFGYDDGDGHAKVAVSHDQGRSWTSIRDVGTPAGVVQSAFPVSAAGDGGRAAVAFLGTSYAGSGAFGDNPTWPGVWYLFVAETFDGGNTWTTVNATPNDPVQRGTICAGGPLNCGSGTRNLLDFMDATVDGKGRFLVGYPDGCVGACIAAGPGSFTSIASIARQVSGKRLLAAYDTVAAPAAPVLYAKSSSSPLQNLLSWTEPQDNGSAITSYRIYRNGSLLATVAGTQRGYTDAAIAGGTTYTYQLSAVNAVGEGAKSPAVTPEVVAPTPVVDPCAEPGAGILTDPTGDSTGGDAAKDVQSLSIAEPRSIGLGKLELILKVASLANVPASSSWPVQFKTPDGADHWVKMATSLTGAVSYAYGDGTTVSNAGTPAPGSSYSIDGTIRLVLARSAIGVAPNGQLSGFLVRVRTESGVGSALTPDNMPDNLSPSGGYRVYGNENCTPPQPDLVVGTNDVGWYQDSKGVVTFVATVHNLGTVDAANTPVAFTVDGTRIAAPSAALVRSGGGVARVTAQWASRGQNGPHTVTIGADPANTVAELDETNNSASKAFTVKGNAVGG